jgi:hypothetical protein
MSLIDNKAVLYILPAAAELSYIAELKLPTNFYMDDLLTYAIAYLERQYERCIEDIIYDDIYDYFSLVHSSVANVPYMGMGTEYGAKSLHDAVSEMANSAMMMILNISTILAPLLGKVFEHTNMDNLRFRSAVVHKGDLVVIYDKV